MKTIEDAKLITCILPKGRAASIQQALVEVYGIHNATFHHARGVGRFSPISSRGIGEQQEKEIIEIAVPADRADELFEFMYDKGEMGRPHGGIIYITAVPKTTFFELPVLTSASG